MTRSKSRAGTTYKVSEKPTTARLPREITQFMNGNEVNLSAASRYWRKCWDAVKECVSEQWEPKGENRYKLRAPFFQVFKQKLLEVVQQHFKRSPENGAELIAHALYRGVYGFGEQQLPPMDWSEYERLWPAHRPISEAWEGMGNLTPPGGTFFVLEDPGPGCLLRIANPRDQSFPRIGVSKNWSNDKDALPKLTIQVEGAPVCMLMKAPYRLRDPEERRNTRMEARRIWDSIDKRIRASLGIQRLKGGRPAEDLGGEASYLHDHHGLSWRQVAEKLCQKKHVHDHACRENLRKLAEQRWKKVRKHAFAQLGSKG